MATRTDTLRIRLEADGDAGVKASLAGVGKELGAVDAAAKSAAASTGQLQSVAARASREFSAFKNTIAAIAGPAALGAWIKSQIDVGDELNKLSQKVGISVEKLSAYTYAAKLADVGNGELQQSIVQLTRSMAEALANPAGEAALTFNALGIEVTDATGKMRGADAVLEDLAARFANAPDGPEKTAAAVALLGRSGSELIPLLNGMRELTDEAERSGKIISTGFAQASEQFNDNITKMTDSFGLFLARSESGTGILDGLNGVLKGVAFAGLGLAQGFEQLGTRIGGLAAATAAAVTGDFAAARAILKELDTDLTRIAAKGEAARAALFADRPVSAGPDRTKPIPPPRGAPGRGSGGGGSGGSEFDRIAAAEFAAFDREIAAIEKQDALIEKLRDAADPMRVMQRELENLWELFDAGRLTVDEFATLEAQAFDRGSGAINAHAKAGEDAFARLEAATLGWGNQFTETLTQAVLTGKLNFKSLADSIIADLLRIAIRQSIVNPILGAFGIKGFADGGYHEGGLRIVGERGPELEATGPARYFSADQTRDILGGGGAPSVTINVVNQSGTPLNASASGMRLDVGKINRYIIDVVLDNIDNGGPLRHAVASVR